jgi:hypothetical protein
MTSYTYKPVTTSQIRLVTVTQPVQDGPLEASLEHVELNPEDPIKYTALSYCWGDPSNLVELPCDGGVLRVTPSLYEALGEIIKFSPHKALWIDQICINQDNLEEKAEQVSKMNMIYDSKSNATSRHSAHHAHFT